MADESDLVHCCFPSSDEGERDSLSCVEYPGTKRQLCCPVRMDASGRYVYGTQMTNLLLCTQHDSEIRRVCVSVHVYLCSPVV